MTELDDIQPPPDILVRRRWISGRKVEYARKADAVMVEHGSIYGGRFYVVARMDPLSDDAPRRAALTRRKRV